MRLCQFALLSLVLVLAAQPLLAATYYVGGCKNGAFGDIQTAVNTVPPGSTIDLCPGTYPQQIVIDKALTLQGIVNSNSSQAIIAAPNTGGAWTTTLNLLGGTVAPQILVTAGPVNISNIIVDGNITPTAPPCPSVDFVGIFYTSGSSGTVNEVETRNQNCSLLGSGIFVENGAGTVQSVTIENSNVNTFTNLGIVACSNQTPSTLTALIKGNNVAGAGDTSSGILTSCYGGPSTNAGSVSGNNISGDVGVSAHSPSSAISGNIITGAEAGIQVLAPAAISGNTVNSTSYGISLKAPASVTSNHISNSAVAGIYFFVAGASIKLNTITQAYVGIEFNCLSGTVSGNTINGASTGIDQVPAAFNGVNKFYNVPTVRTGGPPPC
jgi:hypothetical protein